jgi:hypothetical protein
MLASIPTARDRSRSATHGNQVQAFCQLRGFVPRMPGGDSLILGGQEALLLKGEPQMAMSVTQVVAFTAYSEESFEHAMERATHDACP